MESIYIKKVTLEHVDQLQKVSRQTFLEAFSAGNTGENMEKYLNERFTTELLTAELNYPDSEFYFASIDHTVIGYLKVNAGKSQTVLQDGKGLEIERIYVLQEFLGKRVGQLLYEKAMQIAREKNADYIWLGVWEENARAIQFYKKNGFVEFDKHLFRLGDDEHTDIMMKIELAVL